MKVVIAFLLAAIMFLLSFYLIGVYAELATFFLA